MAEHSRPDPAPDSTGARNRGWRPAAIGLACALGGGLAGWFGHSAWIDRQTVEDRATASGELPQQQPVPAPAPAPGGVTEAAAAPSAPLQQQGEAFVERFDGDIDARWSVSDGWSNGPWMTNDWRRASVTTAPGLLSLTMEPGPGAPLHPLASGELQTHARYRYGYFEIRMKVPRGAGLVTGFFTYAGQADGQRPNEIDIEILGRNTRVAELTIHENGRATSTKVDLPFDAADGFHVYGFDWQPGHVRWYIDGRLAHEETGAAARRLTRPQQLILHLWASEKLHAWLGRLDPAMAPWRLDVACVAYAPSYAGPICT